MNIGIDISQIVYAGSGVSRFTHGLTQSILTYDTAHTWTFFFSSLRQQLDPDIITKIKASRHSLVTYPIPPTILAILGNNLHALSKALTSHVTQFTDLDWFITSDWAEPALPTRKATIVHDLIFKKYPETVHPQILKTQAARLAHVANESDLIFVVSESTGTDLKQEYHIDDKRVMVNHPGVETQPVPSSTDREIVLQKYHITTPYILTVGKQEPRKNIPRLVESFHAAMNQLGNETMKLVIVGPQGWGEMNIEESERVQIVGYVSDEDLAVLYASAQFFVFPSLYEGFGYPVIEAMTYGCPVATSNTSSLVEIAGDAALLFDPQTHESITKALVTLTSNVDLRKALSEKGTMRAAYFTWERYYNNLIQGLTYDNRH